jgi:hypothetical protein
VVDSCKDCTFDQSNIDNARNALLVDENVAGIDNGNVRFINGRIIQTSQNCVLIKGGNGVFIQGNRIGGCSFIDGTKAAVEVRQNVLNFYIDNNFFEPSFSYRFKPTYFVQVDSGASDQYTITHNQMRAANRNTGNISDGGSGLNKMIGPNIEDVVTEHSVNASYISTLSGGAPFIATSTVPAINLNSFPVTYSSNNGTQLPNSYLQWGTGTAATDGTATVTLNPPFNGRYICFANNDTGKAGAAVTGYVSNSRFILTVGRASADAFHYMCLGLQ